MGMKSENVAESRSVRVCCVGDGALESIIGPSILPTVNTFCKLSRREVVTEGRKGMEGDRAGASK